MTHTVKQKLNSLLHEYPKPTGLTIGYGTSGFRAPADSLHWTMIRIGLVAAVRSKVKRG